MNCRIFSSPPSLFPPFPSYQEAAGCCSPQHRFSSSVSMRVCTPPSHPRWCPRWCLQFAKSQARGLCLSSSLREKDVTQQVTRIISEEASSMLLQYILPPLLSDDHPMYKHPSFLLFSSPLLPSPPLSSPPLPSPPLSSPLLLSPPLSSSLLQYNSRSICRQWRVCLFLGEDAPVPWNCRFRLIPIAGGGGDLVGRLPAVVHHLREAPEGGIPAQRRAKATRWYFARSPG